MRRWRKCCKALAGSPASSITFAALRPSGSLWLGSLPAVGSDQGSQFTSEQWTGRLKELGVRISMDGAGRWMDNGFIERLWRRVEIECVYLHGSADPRTMEAELAKWFECCNRWRPHQAPGNHTPEQYYREALQREFERNEAASRVEAA